jgi:hypothetical protein
MKTNPFSSAFSALVIAAILFAGLARTAAAAADPDPRFASDKPVVKYLFIHTQEKPYDIKSLSWYGGVMERIVVENKSPATIIVDFQLTQLANGTVALPARTMRVSKACESGATTVMMEMMSNDGNSALVYSFTHDLHPSDILAGKLLRAGGKLSLAVR